MYGSETIKPVYPAILIATNKNSPGDSCNNLMFFAGIWFFLKCKGLIFTELFCSSSIAVSYTHLRAHET